MHDRRWMTELWLWLYLSECLVIVAEQMVRAWINLIIQFATRELADWHLLSLELSASLSTVLVHCEELLQRDWMAHGLLLKRFSRLEAILDQTGRGCPDVIRIQVQSAHFACTQMKWHLPSLADYLWVATVAKCNTLLLRLVSKILALCLELVFGGDIVVLA